jgi:hypothetical protein
MAYPNHNKRKLQTYKSIFSENIESFKKEYPKFDAAYHESGRVKPTIATLSTHISLHYTLYTEIIYHASKQLRVNHFKV